MKIARTAVLVASLACCAGLAFGQDAKQMEKNAKQQAEKAVQDAKNAAHDAEKAAKDKAHEMAAQPGGQQAMDPKAMMEAYAKAMAPNEHHKAFAAMVGTFDAEVWAQMDPSTPPTVSKGSMVNSMIMGDRVIKQEFKGEFMGQTFEGLGFMSYNPVTDKYDSVWMDSMGGMMTSSTGTCSADHKSWTFEGSECDPMTKQTMKYKDVATVTDNDHHSFTRYYLMPDGKEAKGMEIKYSRKAAAAKTDAKPAAKAIAAPAAKPENKPAPSK